MSYQVLSRKWRPKTFEDVIGQEHITTSLVNSLKRNRTGHAYLFTGTRGVGKTSVARIFSKAIRCESLLDTGNPCEVCESCKSFGDNQTLDIIEIDGASNNSVDNIRELISNVQFLPTSGKYRVYIIDEVHMLSTSAFNALLKTLEEPPEHVIFIFATTEPEKILDTVLSRCQRFDFRSPNKEKLNSLLQKIAEKEDIKFENNNIVDKISFFGNGSVRDSLSILDQLLTFSENNYIDENTLFLGLGLAKQSSLYDLVNFILKNEHEQMVNLYRNLQLENISSEKIYHGLIDTFYELINSLMGGDTNYPHSIEGYGPQELMWIYETLSRDLDWALKSYDVGKSLEIILQKISLRRESLSSKANLPVKKKAIVKTKEIPEEVLEELKPEPVIDEEVSVVTEPIAAEEEIVHEEEKTVIESTEKTWKGFLAHVHEISPVTGHNLEQGNINSEPKIISGNLVVEIGFPKSAKVFFEYLSQSEIQKKLSKEFSEYYCVEIEKIILNFDLKGQEDSFRSVANIKDEEHEEKIKKKEEDLLNNPNLKMAETLFNTKVDKVVVNKQDK
ncbi:MAG: DNA polymerase-3 subunit gamma/tau [Bacteriovoracaceae bacterium]|jgi:DNA polymerase-3 subunit gamma/tau